MPRALHFAPAARARPRAHYYRTHAANPPQVLWAHNSHLGDARATDMSWRRGQLNVGQLVREAYGEDEVCVLGFTTHAGKPPRLRARARARRSC